MVSPLPSVTNHEDIDPSVDFTESAPTPTQSTTNPQGSVVAYANGVSPVAGARLAYYLSKENLGWSLLLLFAADYFGLTNQIIGMVGNVC